MWRSDHRDGVGVYVCTNSEGPFFEAMGIEVEELSYWRQSGNSKWSVPNDHAWHCNYYYMGFHRVS